jgi:hypothetical protein
MHPLAKDAVVLLGKAIALAALVVLGACWLLWPGAEGLS